VSTDPAPAPTWTIAYWALAVFLTAFGIPALASIGAPFLLVGMVMMALWPMRRRARAFWPVLVGVIVFCAVYTLVAPFGCERSGFLSPEGAEVDEQATCTSIVGVGYSGSGDWDPSYVPAILAGLGIGVVAGAVTRQLVGRRSTVH
jgi:hypothetical protein